MKRLAVFFISALLVAALAVAEVKLADLVFGQSFEAVTIKADGSVEPSTAPILKNGDVYTLIGNISGTLAVEKNGTVFDGAGYAVKKLTLNRVNNVTIIYLTVEAGEGIFLNQTTNSIIAHNTVTENSVGIQVLGSGNIIAGNNVTNNHVHGIFLEGLNNTVVRNYIITNGDGIYIYVECTNTVTGNQISNNAIGIHFMTYLNPEYFIRRRPNLVYQNNFDNIQNVVNEAWGVSPLASNWDNGTTGNYWSNYSGGDVNGDGVGEEPHVIDDRNQDNYPLIAPVDVSSMPLELPESPIAPLVTVLSPENATYTIASVPLNFTVNKRTVWMSYSLDGQPFVTVARNITLTELLNGQHTLTVYASDRFGYTGVSEIVYFTVAKPETFPIATVVASAAVTAIIIISLTVYYLTKAKRKKP